MLTLFHLPVESDFCYYGAIEMEAPLVINCSKLKTSFQQQPPRLVRWGFHPSSFLPVMIGIMQDDTVCRIEFARGRKAAAILKDWAEAWPCSMFVEDQKKTAIAMRKLTGKGEDIKLVMIGTPFQHAVWKELQKIPKGEVRTYADVARRIKNPKAVRAVGTACGANPIPILVPCHRVVGSNGGLGGFGGGLPLKEFMLKAEGALKNAA